MKRLTDKQQLLSVAVCGYADADPQRDVDWPGSVKRALKRLYASRADKEAVAEALRQPYCPWCGELYGWCLNAGGTDPCTGDHERIAAYADAQSAPIVYVGWTYRAVSA